MIKVFCLTFRNRFRWGSTARHAYQSWQHPLQPPSDVRDHFSASDQSPSSASGTRSNGVASGVTNSVRRARQAWQHPSVQVRPCSCFRDGSIARHADQSWQHPFHEHSHVPVHFSAPNQSHSSASELLASGRTNSVRHARQACQHPAMLKHPTRSSIRLG